MCADEEEGGKRTSFSSSSLSGPLMPAVAAAAVTETTSTHSVTSGDEIRGRKEGEKVPEREWEAGRKEQIIYDLPACAPALRQQSGCSLHSLAFQ